MPILRYVVVRCVFWDWSYNNYLTYPLWIIHILTHESLIFNIDAARKWVWTVDSVSRIGNAPSIQSSQNTLVAEQEEAV